MVIQDSCDPSVEQCSVPDEIVRLPIDDFRTLPFIFTWSCAAPLIAFSLASKFETFKLRDEYELELLAYFSWIAFAPVVLG